MILKICGLGFRLYLKDKFNQLDFGIVLLTSVDLMFSLANIGNNFDSQKFYIFKGFKVFRLVRLFKLTKAWNTLNVMITALVKAVF